jgi:Bacterial regulatory helix-turn-helix protein, lysR family
MKRQKKSAFIRHGTLPQLAVLEAAVRLGTLARAADELHMAQPTASGLIRRLEQTARAPLFIRTGRRIAPTAAGRILHGAARALFESLDRASAALAALDADARRPAGPHGDNGYSAARAFSLGAVASSETRKNGIPKPRVRALRNARLPHIAGWTTARTCIGTSVRVIEADAIRSSREMDDTIDYSIVFAKTPKGVAEINQRSGALTLQARRVLIMIDGRRPVAELLAVVRSGEFDGIISLLESQNMIEKVDLALLPSRDFEAEDFADTISLLQENAAALRAMPHMHPGELARPAAATPAQADAAANEAHAAHAADAAVIAARAVATASAPRTLEAPVRRPPTISAAGPVTTRDMAAGSARPGTINTTRQQDPATRRPPTLSGARPVAAAEPAGAAEAPVRPASEAPVRPAPEKAVARTEPPAAPVAAPAAAAPGRTVEEEKRLAVKELYAVLGPYGEQPAAKLQECTTIEALREQIKQAGRRVATFRGEKAAQDYLNAVGHG